MDKETESEGLSKTEIKKKLHELQSFAIELAKLPAAELANMPMSETFRQALLEYRALNSNGAKRRQAQYLGKLVKSEETIDETISAYQVLKGHKHAEDAQFHLAEKWRERLLSDDKAALTEFLHDHHDIDVQSLRHQIKKARKEKDLGKNLGAAKQLFRMIRNSL